MPVFSKLVITNEGKELLNNSVVSGKKITFTTAVASSEKHNLEELKALTALEPRQITALKNVNVENDIIKISLEFNNAELTEGYLLQSLGVYAKTDASDVLFAVAKEETESVYIPPKNMGAGGLNIRLTIRLENAENVQINIDPSGVATIIDIHNLEEKIDAHSDDRAVHVTKEDKKAWNLTYEQSTGYTDRAIANLIGGAPETLDTIEEVATAIKENESVVDALNAAIGEKVNKKEFETHANNSDIHITAAERKKWNDVTDRLNGFLVVEKVQSLDKTIAANESITLTATANKSGYTPIGIVGFDCDGSGESNCRVYATWLSGATCAMSVRNAHQSLSATVHAFFYVLYVKTM